MASAFDEIRGEMPAGTLTFLREREIRELTSYMRGHLQRHRLVDRWEILPLYGRLSVEDQASVCFRNPSPHRARDQRGRDQRDGARGACRDRLWGNARFLDSIPNPSASPADRTHQSSLRQPAVRPVRSGGTWFVSSLYDEQSFPPASLHRARDPENQLGRILRMRAMRLGSVKDFPFLDTPNSPCASGTELEKFSARQDGKLTALGRRLSRLPVTPDWVDPIWKASATCVAGNVDACGGLVLA